MTKKEHHKVNELDNPPRRQRHIHGVDILTHETKKKLKEESKFSKKKYNFSYFDFFMVHLSTALSKYYKKNSKYYKGKIIILPSPHGVL